MLSGETPSASAMVGTAVFRIVVSSASMKKATATSHGNNCFVETSCEAGGGIAKAGCGMVPGRQSNPATRLMVRARMPVE